MNLARIGFREARWSVEEGLRLAPEILEQMGSAEFWALLSKQFGGRRATELLGWALVLAVSGLQNGPELRESLRERGLSRSSFYRALADLRAFGEFLERDYHRKMSVEEVVRKLCPVS